MYYNWTENTNTEELKIVCNLIKNGELVIFPTETVYGIGANALDSNAVNKIFIAKGRPSDNPLIVHLANKADIDNIAQNITEVERKLIDNFMPGPFTIILNKKDCIPNNVSGGLDTVAIRIPDNIIAKAIITYSGVPIAAPSANVSGRPSGTNIEDIRKELEGKVSAIVDGGETNIGIESTVVKVKDEVPVILRPGKVTPEEIEKVVGKVVLDENVFKAPKEDTVVESPGMKYKHYSPNTKCKLFYAKDERDLIFEINKQIRIFNDDVVVVGFKEHKDKIKLSNDRFIEVSSKNDTENYAKKIYTDLRKADKVNAKVILIEGVEKEGLRNSYYE